MMQVPGDDRADEEELVLSTSPGHGAIAEVSVYPLTIPTDAPIVSAVVAVMKRKGRALGVLPGSMRSCHRRAHHLIHPEGGIDMTARRPAWDTMPAKV
jgi:hypothetical protein